jgi:Na+/melibiose symporter-like transporter
LPILQWSGFEVGGAQTPAAISMLGTLYAIVPSILKGLAILVLLYLLAPKIRREQHA